MKVVIGLVEHLGDIVACEPVARYVKAKYPGCKVSWVVNDTFRELVDYNPYIDATVTVECLTDWIKFTKHQAYDRIMISMSTTGCASTAAFRWSRQLATPSSAFTSGSTTGLCLRRCRLALACRSSRRHRTFTSVRSTLARSIS